MSSRTHAIVSAIPPSARVLGDIGFDHARIALALLAARSDVRVIGVEVQPEAPARVAASWTASEAALVRDRLVLRAGDGLHGLAPGECDGVLIAGLTGPTIARLLREAPAAVRAGLAFVVLCPTRFEAAIRPTLAALGWVIVAETLAEERQRFYEIIVAQPAALTPTTAATAPDPLATAFGPCLVGGPHPRMQAYLADTQARFREAYAHGLHSYERDDERRALGAKLALVPQLAAALAARSNER